MSFFVTLDPFFGKSKSYSISTDSALTTHDNGYVYQYTTYTAPSFEKFDQIFNDIWSEAVGKQTKVNPISDMTSKLNFPKIDLYSDGEKAVLLASVPGYKKEDLDVELVKNILSISSKESALESDLKNLTKVHGEIKKSKFTREIVLNEDILDLKDIKKFDITLENGILKIVIPFIEEKIIKKNTLKIK